MRRKLSLICFLCIAGIYAAFLHPAASLLFGAALVFILYICPFPEISFSASLKKAAVLAFFLGILVEWEDRACGTQFGSHVTDGSLYFTR